MNEIAIIGWQKSPWNFAATHFKTFEAFKKNDGEKLKFTFFILQAPPSIEALQNLLEELSKRETPHQIIIVESNPYQVQQLAPLVNTYPIVSILPKQDRHRVEDLLNLIVLTQRFEEQEQVHQELIREEESRQEKQYKALMEDLTEKQNQLAEMQSRILSGLQQEKLLHETLLIIMTSQSIHEIEGRLQQTLISLFGSLKLRIQLHADSSDREIPSAEPSTEDEAPLRFILHDQDNPIGDLSVWPEANQKFHRRELRLLENMSEAVALHIPRFQAFEANTALETEWRTTFNSISDPLLLVTEDYKVVDANKAALLRMAQSPLPEGRCYEKMFNRTSPCPFCQWGTKANVEQNPRQKGEIWEMSSHDLPVRKSQQKLYVHVYRNKFEQRELENRISALAQSTEVGIFKASLAHELNNPIGGLLTLAQLQKMDLDANHPLYEQVRDIETQALQCRDLILQLLQRAR